MTLSFKTMEVPGLRGRLRIRGRLILGFAAVIAITVVMAVATLVQLSGFRASVVHIDVQRVPTALASTAMSREIYASLASLRGFMLTGEAHFSAERAAVWEEIADTRAELDALSAGWTSADDIARWQGFTGLLDAFSAIQDRIETASAGGDAAEAKRLLVAEAAPLAGELLDLLLGKEQADGHRAGGMVGHQREELKHDVHEEVAALDVLTLGLWGLLGLTLLVAIAAVLLTSRSIVDPVASMTGAMNRLAGGDKEIDVPGLERADEIGEMAQAVEVFKTGMIEAERLAAEQAEQQAERARRAEAIEGLTGRFDEAVSGLLDTVVASAGQLNDTAQSMQGLAQGASERSGAVAAASEQASANVQTVASASEELSSSIGEISQQVSASAQTAQEAVSITERAKARIAGLAEASQRIGEVVDLISDIAEQTNLLALRGRRFRGEGAGGADRRGDQRDRRAGQRHPGGDQRRGRGDPGDLGDDRADQHGDRHDRRRGRGAGCGDGRDQPQRPGGGERHRAGQRQHQRRQRGGRPDRPLGRRGAAGGPRAVAEV